MFSIEVISTGNQQVLQSKKNTGRFLIELLFQFLSLRSHILVSGYNNVTISELAHTPLRFPPIPDILHSYLRNPMVFVISELNGCTYKLDANNQRVLMYAPLLSDGSYETAGSAYDWVEWDRLDPDVLEEADRIHKLLLAEV